jgi:hypothetical protein
MKTKIRLSMLITFLLGAVIGAAAAPVLTGAAFVAGKYALERNYQTPAGALMVVGADLDALTTDFVNFGGKLWMQNVNDWEVDPFIPVWKGITKPEALPKLSAVGGPRPYTPGDNLDNGVAFTDRVLTVHQSKWDYDLDPEVFRNKYLASPEMNNGMPFYEFIINQVAKTYLAAINDETQLDGEYDVAGTSAADLADGFGTLIRTAIGDGDLTEIATGAITANNAVTKIEQVADALPVWMQKKPVQIMCSYTVFKYYRTHYRATFGFSFNPAQNGKYLLDGQTNIELVPKSWMGSSLGVIATVADNLIIGTDIERITVAATKRRNIIEVRQMMPIGFQIADLDALFVNDQFTP